MATVSEKHSLTDMLHLKKKAENFCQQNLYWLPLQVKQFYRDKNREYFHEIFRTEGGCMKRRLKGQSGDPRSPINGRLSGMFFASNVTYKPPHKPLPVSIYGPMRLEVPVQRLQEICPNLYFGAFYCLKKGKSHHIILVMTKPGSDADIFCAEHLPFLNPHNNNFLKFTPDGDMAEYCTEHIYYEIFFTEDLDISIYESDGNSLRQVGVKPGFERIAGGCRIQPQKWSDCTVCNLPPYNLEGCYNLEELDQLMQKAERFIDKNTEPEHFHITEFYIDESAEYFRSVFETSRGKLRQIFRKCTGDTRCPINKNVKGHILFCNENYNIKQPTLPSYSGLKRLYLPVEFVHLQCFEQAHQGINLYFADFYCTTPMMPRPHYVTLVMSQPDCEGDYFCRQHLLKLDPCNNSFLQFNQEGSSAQYKTRAVHCEILVLMKHQLIVSGYQNALREVENTSTSGINLRRTKYGCEECS